MTTLNDISGSIAAAQKQSGISTSELAKLAGISRAGLYRFFNGEDVRMTTVLAVLNALDLDTVCIPKCASNAIQSNYQNELTGSERTHIQTAVQSRLARLRADIAKLRRNKLGISR